MSRHERKVLRIFRLLTVVAVVVIPVAIALVLVALKYLISLF